MRIIISVEVEVADQAQADQMQKTLNKYGFRFTAAKEIDDGMSGKSPLAGPFIQKMVYKRNPF